MYSFLNIINTLRVKRSFWDEVKYEIRDLIDTFAEFFVMIKEHTYDPLVAEYGDFAINLLGIGLIVALIMIACILFINR